MPWWAWISIGVLALITIAFSAWYVLSAGHYWLGNKTINWKRFLKTHYPLTEAQIQKLKTTPVALLMVVGKHDLQASSQPLYLFPSSDAQDSINYWIQKINNHYQNQISHPITDYLIQTQQTPEMVKFYLFCKYPNEISLNQQFSELLIKSNLKQLGFNKVIL